MKIGSAPTSGVKPSRTCAMLNRTTPVSYTHLDVYKRQSLYRALSPDGNPSFATVLKVAKALGVRLHAQAASSGV